MVTTRGQKTRSKANLSEPFLGSLGTKKGTKVLLSYPEMCSCKQTNLVNFRLQEVLPGQPHSRLWEAEELSVLSA